MPRDEVKQKKVTFAHSMPMGERGTFTHDGDLWIAYRAKKNQRINGLLDRLLGIHAGITQEMVAWVNKRPGDAELAAYVLERTTRARKLQQELTMEKLKAVTE